MDNVTRLDSESLAWPSGFWSFCIIVIKAKIKDRSKEKNCGGESWKTNANLKNDDLQVYVLPRINNYQYLKTSPVFHIFPVAKYLQHIFFT